MKKVNLDFILPLFVYFWALYACYTIMLTCYDFSSMKHIEWTNAENHTVVYASLRSTTVTYNFVKDKIRISRQYPGIIEGLNTWLWGIDKKSRKLDISFYLRESDYNRIKKKEIKQKQDIFGGKVNEMEAFPFFGLSKITFRSNAFLRWTDLWKYNYKWWIFSFFLLAPGLIVFLIKKLNKVEVVETVTPSKSSKIHDYVFWTLAGINLFNLFI